MKYLITTLITANHYQWYAPMFVYSCKRANPEADIKIFVHGKMKDSVRSLCSGAEIIDDVFPEYNHTTINALRFLIPPEHFEGYKFVYFTDIDFVFLQHEPSLMKYFVDVLKKTKQNYAGWKGGRKSRARIAAGTIMVSNKWLKKTQPYRDKYLEKLGKTSGVGRIFDELMLAKICKQAGYKRPKTRRHFLTGSYDQEYRSLHLGDFKRKSRYNDIKKMNYYLTMKNIRKYITLRKESGWMKIEKACARNKTVGIVLGNVRKHIRVRYV